MLKRSKSKALERNIDCLPSYKALWDLASPCIYFSYTLANLLCSVYSHNTQEPQYIPFPLFKALSFSLSLFPLIFLFKSEKFTRLAPHTGPSPRPLGFLLL
jgi:hypothetical protein